MENLSEYRKSIDNIDNAIVAMFAERFKITNKVGEYKAVNGLPAQDVEREQAQFDRVSELAEGYGLDPIFAQAFLKTVIAKVVENHIEIAKSQTVKGGI